MASMLRWGAINVLVLIILAGFLVTIIQAASADKLEENSKVEPAEKKTVEGAVTSPWDKVKSWAGLASKKLPKSFSFKKTAAPASQDSPGAAEKVKGAATKGYEIGKKATQDVIENVGQAAQKTGEKIKQTAGKAHGEL